MILPVFPLYQFPVNLLRLKRLVFRHEKFFRSVDHLFCRTAELFRFLAPIDVPFGVHVFDRHGNSEVFQYFGKEIVQVLGFHQRDGFFVYRADIGQHVAGFQPGKIDFVIKYLAAPVSFVPENEPAGFSGTYDGFELMIVGTDDLFQAFFRHGFPDKSLGPIRHQFGFGMYDVQYRTVFVIEDEHIGNGIEHRAVQIGYFLGMTGITHRLYYFCCFIGIFTENREPFPGWEDTAIRPPMPSIMVLQTDRPSPAPCLKESIL